MITVKTNLSEIPAIGIKYALILKKLSIETVEDFLLHFPFRYEDYSERTSIDNLSAGQIATVMGEVVKSKLIRTWKKKMLIVECFVSDDTGTVRAVWFNQPYVSDSLIVGKGARLSGKVSEDTKGLFFSNPAWELSSRVPTNTGRLVPVYPETEGLTSRWMRWKMQTLIKYASEIKDPIPENILKELHLPKISDAINYAHFPKTLKQSVLAQKRLAFDQMFFAQLAAQSVKISWNKKRAETIPFDEKMIKKFVSALPFSLTNAQRKAAFQILKDIEKPLPMNRLLNGDVGSGKTVVAAMACLAMTNAGYQAAFMAPTEILARQHYENISKLFAPYKITVALLTNSYQQVSNLKFKISNLKLKDNTTSTELKRSELLEKISSGDINVVIGTHALIQKDVHPVKSAEGGAEQFNRVKFKNLALVIIDEQHRFGVDQRATLLTNSPVPHFLTMTATPIPRTLALAFFGNLNLSVLDEMPKNRKVVITEIVGARDRQKTYEFVRSEIKKGRQAFIIFPLVEESSKLSELKAATQEHKRLSKNIFPDLKLALLHGKMPAKSGSASGGKELPNKESVMNDFQNKKYDILVATSVVEVGIDIPNATIMIVEDADRFGLSQLHQFRGRVGRSEMQSYCFLFTGSSASKAKARLKALVKNSNGFDIAQKDFKLRGPGEFFGSRQSGLPDIAMQHITNVKLIEIAQSYAEKTLKESPDLEKFPLLKKELERFNQNVHLE